MNDQILQWTSAVEDALNMYARKLSKDRKDDLRQEVYLALLQSETPIEKSEQAYHIAQKVINRNRMENVRENETVECISDDPHKKKSEQCLTLSFESASPLRHAVPKAVNLRKSVGPEIFQQHGLEDRIALNQALQQLPAQLREVIEDLFIEGLTQEETARKKGVSQQRVEQKKSQALKLLKQYLTRSK